MACAKALLSMFLLVPCDDPASGQAVEERRTGHSKQTVVTVGQSESAGEALSVEPAKAKVPVGDPDPGPVED